MNTRLLSSNNVIDPFAVHTSRKSSIYASYLPLSMPRGDLVVPRAPLGALAGTSARAQSLRPQLQTRERTDDCFVGRDVVGVFGTRLPTRRPPFLSPAGPAAAAAARPSRRGGASHLGGGGRRSTANDTVSRSCGASTGSVRGSTRGGVCLSYEPDAPERLEKRRRALLHRYQARRRARETVPDARGRSGRHGRHGRHRRHGRGIGRASCRERV